MLLTPNTNSKSSSPKKKLGDITNVTKVEGTNILKENSEGHKVEDANIVSENGKLVFANISRGSRFETPDFEIPDLTIPQGKQFVQKEIDFEIENPEISNLKATIELNHFSDISGQSLHREFIGYVGRDMAFSFT